MWPEADRQRAPLGAFPPRWASAWGDDEFGLWAELVLGGVVQRLRWIEPGQFTMGSSAQEREVLDDKALREWADQSESPQHLVTISRGFWLADTPCTQALWQGVLGHNPSRFASAKEAPTRPVKQVSWDDVQGFLAALREQLPQADAVLPTDAQWEYACRAGTRSAYHWGDAPDTTRANMGGSHETSAVKHYPPNAWGLYDMHGNVWEWCADTLKAYSDQAELDPWGGTEGDARVLRGGAWDDPAGLARSAFRYHARRGDSWPFAGFRLALRSPSPAGGAAGA